MNNKRMGAAHMLERRWDGLGSPEGHQGILPGSGGGICNLSPYLRRTSVCLVGIVSSQETQPDHCQDEVKILAPHT